MMAEWGAGWGEEVGMGGWAAAERPWGQGKKPAGGGGHT